MNRVYERRWLRFAKGGRMKYIGHLDMLRLFQAAIRRAGLPIAYSMGFNPHQRLSFAFPLPVGMDSLCEYIELLFESKDVPGNDAIWALDEQFPDGLRLLDVYAVPEKVQKPAAAVAAADYRMIFPGSEAAGGCLQSLMDAPEIIMMKKSKSGEKEADIRQDIFLLERDLDAVNMRLTAGSSRNLNPMLVAQKIFGCMGIDPPLHEIKLTRRELYALKNGEFVPLHEIAVP